MGLFQKHFCHSFSHSISQSVRDPLSHIFEHFSLPNRKSYRPDIFRECSLVTGHVTCVKCPLISYLLGKLLKTRLRDYIGLRKVTFTDNHNHIQRQRTQRASSSISTPQLIYCAWPTLASSLNSEWKQACHDVMISLTWNPYWTPPEVIDFVSFHKV